MQTCKQKWRRQNWTKKGSNLRARSPCRASRRVSQASTDRGQTTLTLRRRRVTCVDTTSPAQMSSQLVTSTILVAAIVPTPHLPHTSRHKPCTIISEFNLIRCSLTSLIRCSQTAKTSSCEWQSSSKHLVTGQQVTPTLSASLQIQAKRWLKIRGIQIPKSHSHQCKNAACHRPIWAAATRSRMMRMVTTCSRTATVNHHNSQWQMILCLITPKLIVWINRIRASTKHSAKFWIHWTMTMLILVDRRQPITIFSMLFLRKSP